MPICPNCGSYFVRKPCPACSDIQDIDAPSPSETGRKIVPVSAKPFKERQTVESYTPVVSPPVKEYDTESKSDPQAEVERLRGIINDQERKIAHLKKVILLAKTELDQS